MYITNKKTRRNNKLNNEINFIESFFNYNDVFYFNLDSFKRGELF